MQISNRSRWLGVVVLGLLAGGIAVACNGSAHGSGEGGMAKGESAERSKDELS